MLKVNRGLSRIPTTSMPASAIGWMPSRYPGTSVSNGASSWVRVATVNTASGRCSSTYAVLARLKALHSASRVARLGTEAAGGHQQRDDFPAARLRDGAQGGQVLLGVRIPQHHDPFGDLAGLDLLPAAFQQRIRRRIPVGARPSMSAHSFSMAAGAGMIRAAGAGVAAVSRVSWAAPGVSSRGCAAVAASSAVRLVCQTATGPARTAQQAAMTTAVRQLRTCGQCHSRSGFSTKRVVRTARTTEAAMIAPPWLRLGDSTPVAASASTRTGQCHSRGRRSYRPAKPAASSSGSGPRQTGCRFGRPQ